MRIKNAFQRLAIQIRSQTTAHSVKSTTILGFLTAGAVKSIVSAASRLTCCFNARSSFYRQRGEEIESEYPQSTDGFSWDFFAFCFSIIFVLRCRGNDSERLKDFYLSTEVRGLSTFRAVVKSKGVKWWIASPFDSCQFP